jgi:hypothetical protein
MVEPEKLKELKLSFSLWRLRPIRRNSVFDGFNDKRFRVSQEWTKWRVSVSRLMAALESLEAKEI